MENAFEFIVPALALSIPIVAIVVGAFTNKNSLLAQALARKIDKRNPPNTIEAHPNAPNDGNLEERVLQLEEELRFMRRLLEDDQKPDE